VQENWYEGAKHGSNGRVRGADVAKLISIIVTTYNREDALDAVLRSLAQQSDAAFEIIVADDGSGPATAKLIESWRPKIDRRLEHVWHADRGFRAAEIRNHAILAARGAYCLFLDGDCIVRTDFVANHRRLAEPGWFVTGNRVLLSPELTAKVLLEKLAPESWTIARWLAERWHNGINRLSAIFYLPLGPLRRIRQGIWKDARSCNLAIWRSDLDRIDGFDADYMGWGKEDSDVIIRLLHAGVRRKEGLFSTGVIHLWHPEADRSQLSKNEHKLAEVVAGHRIRAKRGLSSLQGSSADALATS
jgi:glycosyltransferase involved in cell wall biosynthesis